jgi:hypothetical protein
MNQLDVSTYHRQLVCDAAVANDLGPYVERLQALIRPSIVLATSRAKASSLAVGTTKIGGAPDLPESLPWPEWNRQLLAFYGQINLTDIAPFELGLPTEGLLSFFFATDMDATRAQCTGAGIVCRFTNQPLQRRKPPPRAPDPFRSCAVNIISYPSLPWGYSLRDQDMWGLDFVQQEDLHDAYAECVDSIKSTLHIGDDHHQFLGYPRPVQHTPIEICMQRARTVPPPPPLLHRVQHSLWEGFKNFALSRNPPINTPLPEASRSPDDLERCRDWKLLLELREDENADIQLIDSGRIYFMYPSEQLRCGDFSMPWTMLDFG